MTSYAFIDLKEEDFDEEFLQFKREVMDGMGSPGERGRSGAPGAMIPGTQKWLSILQISSGDCVSRIRLPYCWVPYVDGHPVYSGENSMGGESRKFVNAIRERRSAIFFPCVEGYILYYHGSKNEIRNYNNLLVLKENDANIIVNWLEHILSRVPKGYSLV